jgi:hypothetical protein
MRWQAAARITLDEGGKLTFGALETAPGLYRMMLTGINLTRPKVYIGETDNLRRRLVGNYRNPGPTQQTSLRINALLREHLNAGGAADLSIATSVSVILSKARLQLDLRRKASRLLAENAALVVENLAAEADIVNLG